MNHAIPDAREPASASTLDQRASRILAGTGHPGPESARSPEARIRKAADHEFRAHESPARELAHRLFNRAAARALAITERDPLRRRQLGVVGVRGSGKTAVLDAFARAFVDAGVVVHRRIADAEAARPRSRPRATDDALGRRDVLIVDNADRLDDDDLDRMLALACDDDGASLILGYRPWPERPALTAIVERLESIEDGVILGALDTHDAAEWSSSVLDRPLSPDDLARLLALTGGQPWLVARTLESIAADGDGVLHGADVPAELADRIAFELARLEPDLLAFTLALLVGFDPSSPVALPNFDAGPSSIEDAINAAHAAGLLGADERVVPLVASVLLRTTPRHRVLAAQRALLDAYVAAGKPLDPLIARGDEWLQLKDPRLAGALVRLGDSALSTAPALASEYYEAAITASADVTAIADAIRVRRAQAALAVGDTDAAGRLLERHFAATEPADVARGVDVAAAHWAERGMPTRSADVYRWLGAERVGDAAPNAAIALYGAGAPEEARRMLDLPESGFPTAVAVSARLASRGLRDSLSLDGGSSLPRLVRASATLTSAGVAVPLPESPAALAALVAMHVGEHATAGAVLDAAIEGAQGGPGAQRRLRLLRAWAWMLSGHDARAAAEAADVRRDAASLGPRDAFFASALDVALARRASDVGELARAWPAAREHLLSMSAGLFMLLPLGELVIAAARMRDAGSVRQPLADAWALLERLDSPPLWSTPLHWACVQAGIIENQPAQLSPHAEALVRAAPHHPLAATLAAAGGCWVRVLGGRAAADDVESAARRLAAAGLPWDGAHLAGHAAARVEDRKDMVRLLQTARDLHTEQAPAATHDRGQGPDAPGAGRATPPPLEIVAGESDHGDPDPAATGGDDGPRESRASRAAEHADHDTLGLSDREWEVVRLVLRGMTYVEVGRDLFMSPRTVEHHMARIRRRLGAASRSEMLDRLRIALGGRN